MRRSVFLLIWLMSSAPLLAVTPTELKARQWQERHAIPRRPPGYIEVGIGFPLSARILGAMNTAEYDQKRLMAGHLLRRLGFGPDKTEMEAVLSMGIPAYLDMQLNPAGINDDRALSRLPPLPSDYYADYERIQRWYTRMVYSRRQLQEKMTLILHEHFSVSNGKVGIGAFMNQHENLLRDYALGSFRDLLIDVTRDPAMLVFLDNNFNSGNAVDDQGKRIPPNENYAREFLQLFALGTIRLNMDGTPVLDSNQQPRPNYTEKDVKEVARALTGWYAEPRAGSKSSRFDARIHDSGKKTILGVPIQGRKGADGAREVADVVNIVMKQPSVPPFISKILIQKLVTETPTRGYVQRVATVFASSDGNLKSTVRAILMDPEFYSPDVVRTQFKEPIEYFVGALRALHGKTKGAALIDWTYGAQQLVYYPPSVFSFYPPGNKVLLTNTALVTIRDRVADDIIAGYNDTSFSTRDIFPKRDSLTPEQITDQLADIMLAAPLETSTRQRVIEFFRGHVDDERVRGAVWLILCSPEYQRN